MSLHEFRENLRKLRAKSRREGLRNMVLGAGVLALFTLTFGQATAPLQRFSFVLIVLGTVAAVVPDVLALWRGVRSSNPAPDIAMTTGIQFYRRLLEPQSTRDTWNAVCLLLIFFSLMLILLPGVSNQIENPNSRVSIRSILPFSLILVAWGVSFIVLRRRQQRGLRRELEMLSTLEKENQ